jgi:hypothetical protein
MTIDEVIGGALALFIGILVLLWISSPAFEAGPVMIGIGGLLGIVLIICGLGILLGPPL